MSRRDVSDAGDRGFATVWVVTAMGVVVIAAAVAIGLGVAVVERHRAAAAADAVALVAALDAVQGPQVACDRGRDLGRLDGAMLTRCRLDGAVSEIEVSVALPGPLAAFGVATGRARAGPVSVASDLPE
jgi:secretion/DNA translocation related TadE-like protein